MKLKSSQSQDVQILAVEGEITVHDVQVLHAGVRQLMKAGKNRIVINLPDAKALPSEVLRDLSALDLLARELAGRVVLAGINNDMRVKIESFARPPVVSSFDSIEKAIASFTAPPLDAVKEKPVVAPPAPAPTAAAAPGAAATAAATPASAAPPAPVDPLAAKKAIIQTEQGELGTIRKQLAEARARGEALESQFATLLMERRAPPTLAAAEKKIQFLEERLAQVLEELKNVPAAPK